MKPGRGTLRKVSLPLPDHISPYTWPELWVTDTFSWKSWNRHEEAALKYLVWSYSPKYRGKYCLGERRRYKVCNTTPCPHDLPNFRDLQCSHFNSMPYKGRFYKWETVFNRGKMALIGFKQIWKEHGWMYIKVECWWILQLCILLFCWVSSKTLPVSPCELHCRPLKEHFSEKMRDAVIDGTPCYESNESRDMCINGICKVSTR